VAAVSPPVALTVAGSDPCGGAGLQADLRTFAAHGLYGTAVIAGITVQDSGGVREAVAVDAGLVGRQLAAALGDLPVAAWKTGMLGSAAVVAAVAERAADAPPLVVDPVWKPSAGVALVADDALAELRRLIGLAALVAPNAGEAAALLGRDLPPTEAARALVEKLGAAAAVVTGGEGPDHGWDGEAFVVDGGAVPGVDPHGTGCLYTAAATAALARGATAREAAVHARRCATRGVAQALALGRGAPAVWLPTEP
jgi:hydroxymethylpyrimidine/phosphomethylpyrimidine kinase